MTIETRKQALKHLLGKLERLKPERLQRPGVCRYGDPDQDGRSCIVGSLMPKKTLAWVSACEIRNSRNVYELMYNYEEAPIPRWMRLAEIELSALQSHFDKFGDRPVEKYLEHAQDYVREKLGEAA